MMQELKILEEEALPTFKITNMILLRTHLARLNNADIPPQKFKVKGKKNKFKEIGFNMWHYRPNPEGDMSPHNCETSCCIAGHAVLLSKSNETPEEDASVFFRAKDWLGLTKDQATWLFHGSCETLSEAIEILDKMIITGSCPERKIIGPISISDDENGLTALSFDDKPAS